MEGSLSIQPRRHFLSFYGGCGGNSDLQRRYLLSQFKTTTLSMFLTFLVSVYSESILCAQLG